MARDSSCLSCHHEHPRGACPAWSHTRYRGSTGEGDPPARSCEHRSPQSLHETSQAPVLISCPKGVPLPNETSGTPVKSSPNKNPVSGTGRWVHPRVPPPRPGLPFSGCFPLSCTPPHPPPRPPCPEVLSPAPAEAVPVPGAHVGGWEREGHTLRSGRRVWSRKSLREILGDVGWQETKALGCGRLLPPLPPNH